MESEALQPPAASVDAGTLRLFFVRCLAVVAIFVSGAMVVDQFAVVAPFCGGDHGCDAVTSTNFGKPLGIPLSALGLAAFTGYLAISLFNGLWPRIVLGWASIVAGAVGLGLIFTQYFVVEQFCPMCVVIDSAGILMALIDCVWPLANAARAAGRRISWIAVATVAAAGPMTWYQLQPDPVAPGFVREKWSTGKVNVVEVLDFDCVFCRETHPVLKDVLARAGSDVQFARIPLALDSGGLSRDAGKRYLKAVRDGSAEQVADALMEGESLTDEHVKPPEISDSPPTDDVFGREVDQSTAAYHTAVLKGLPQIWVDDIPLIGAGDARRIEAAIERARSRKVARPATESAREANPNR